MKIVKFNDINFNKEYFVALKGCNGKYFPKEVTKYYDDRQCRYMLKDTKGIKFPYSAFAYIENGNDIFGNSENYLIIFNDYIECNKWCLSQIRF